MTTTIVTPPRPAAPRWLTIPAALLVAGITIVAFVVSYHALRELAALAGFMASSAAMWPLIVDGIIVLSIVVLFAWRDRSLWSTWTAWVGLIGFTAISLVGNGLHTAVVYDTGAGLETWVAIAIGAVPPAGLAYSIHLLVGMLAPESAVRDETRAVEMAASSASAPSASMATPLAAPATAAGAAPALPVHELTPVPVTEPATGPAVHDAEPAMAPEATGVSSRVQPAEPLTQTNEPDPDPVDQHPARVTLLDVIEPIPADLDGQVEWIAERVRHGRDVTPKALTRIFDEAGQPVSPSTLKRRIAKARELAG